MTSAMLIATAGHIDHGKSALVKALSGQETDRLPEEKARGISIDLGFAYWRPDQNTTIGFVDVPGHERFVRNMLAGLSGINFALLVVAADDGVMPQTLEHLQILNLLGVNQGVVAITKIDRVDPQRIGQVRSEIASLKSHTGLANAGICALSARTGEGIAELAAAILARRDEPVQDNDRGFRLAIDRVFSVTGAGTVATGTVVSGSAQSGDVLMLSPQGRECRIRGMQSAGNNVERISRGKRCALNLSGIDVSEVRRGDWLTIPRAHAPTSRIEAHFAQLTDCDSELRHGSQVHFHHGTAYIGARVLVTRQRSISPGEEAVVQLALDAPTSAVSGDRFILRDQSGRQLLGGGTVLNPLATDYRRPLSMREAHARAMALPLPEEKLSALAAAPGIEPDLRWLGLACNLTSNALAQTVAKAEVKLAGQEHSIAIMPDRFVGLCDLLVAALTAHHQQHPGEPGLSRRAARQMLGEPVSPELFASLMAALIAECTIEAHGPLISLAGHIASFSKLEEDLWRKLLDFFDDDRPLPVVLTEAARELHVSESALAAMLHKRSIRGQIWKISHARYMLPVHVAQLAEIAAEADAASEHGFTAGQLRDASGLGRNFIIQLLEFFDRIGVTRRMRETRKMRPDWRTVVGPAKTD
jgi:selenocysteine-specific elongation factor